MNSLSISFSKAVELLKVSEDEVLEIKNILKLNGICWQGRYFVLAFIFDDKNRCKQLEMITFLGNACDKINMRKKETYYEYL